jgi:glycolate oxidase iron-sulfur subunit
MEQSASPPPEDARTRLLGLTDACVLCGLCLPHCPTYALDAVETESPRGRIMLAQAQAAGRGSLDASSQLALDHCLGCGRCEQVCPAKVRYGEILRLSRSLSPPASRPLAVRALRWAGRHPRWLARLLRAARPARIAVPNPLRRWLKSATQPIGSQVSKGRSSADLSLRIGLLTGCVAQSLDAQTQRAIVRLLNAAGHDVMIASAQACCGALPAHEGALAEAQLDSHRNRAAWAAAAPDLLLSSASGCHGAFAAGLSEVAPVKDVLEFLANDEAFAQLSLKPVEQRVALHLPCTQRALSGSISAVRALLDRVPRLRWSELPDSGCCGAAGAHQLRYPERARALRQPLVESALDDGATTLLTANIGCRLHLEATAALSAIRILHPAQLLAEALP